MSSGYLNFGLLDFFTDDRNAIGILGPNAVALSFTLFQRVLALEFHCSEEISVGDGLKDCEEGKKGGRVSEGTTTEVKKGG